MHYDILFFFFQAEDGIRDKLVTGVQTCALPIWCHGHAAANELRRGGPELLANGGPQHVTGGGPADVPPKVRNPAQLRSGERRVGEEGRSRWAPYHLKKKKKKTKKSKHLCRAHGE